MNTLRKRFFSVFLAMAAMLLLAGCAHVISKEALKEVDTTVTFSQVAQDPDAYKGKTVLLGGDIIKAQNFSNMTLIVVLQRPLGRRGEPAAGDVSEGRFIGHLQPRKEDHRGGHGGGQRGTPPG